MAKAVRCAMGPWLNPCGLVGSVNEDMRGARASSIISPAQVAVITFKVRSFIGAIFSGIDTFFEGQVAVV